MINVNKNLINNAVPAQVTNVQVFQYHPLINDKSRRNVLVTWNNLSEVVSNFNVRVVDYSTGMDLDVSSFSLRSTDYVILL